MRLINAVLAHHDPSSTEQLGDSLRKEFRNLVVVNSATELRSAVARYRAPFAVVDLELISLDELKPLCQDSPATAFVCIHRRPHVVGRAGRWRSRLLPLRRPGGDFVCVGEVRGFKPQPRR